MTRRALLLKRPSGVSAACAMHHDSLEHAVAAQLRCRGPTSRKRRPTSDLSIQNNTRWAAFTTEMTPSVVRDNALHCRSPARNCGHVGGERAKVRGDIRRLYRAFEVQRSATEDRFAARALLTEDFQQTKLGARSSPLSPLHQRAVFNSLSRSLVDALTQLGHRLPRPGSSARAGALRQPPRALQMDSFHGTRTHSRCAHASHSTKWCGAWIESR